MEQQRPIGVRLTETQIADLTKIGALNMRKTATEARVAILDHIEKNKKGSKR